jgi:hypothetical protein
MLTAQARMPVTDFESALPPPDIAPVVEGDDMDPSSSEI